MMACANDEMPNLASANKTTSSVKKFNDSDFNEDFNKYPRARNFIFDRLADALKRMKICF